MLCLIMVMMLIFLLWLLGGVNVMVLFSIVV